MTTKVTPQPEFGCANSATDVAATAGCGDACARVSTGVTIFSLLVVVDVKGH